MHLHHHLHATEHMNFQDYRLDAELVDYVIERKQRTGSQRSQCQGNKLAFRVRQA